MEEQKTKSVLSRRGFLKVGGAAMGTVVLGGVIAGCGSDGTTATTDTSTGAAAVTLKEANALRKTLIDSKGAYTTSTGTVIPAVYVKLRTLICTLGSGAGSAVTDTSFNQIMYLFTEDEAQAVLEMPIGALFTAADFSVASGRTEADCLAICEKLALRGLLFRVRRAGVAYFHPVAEFFGMVEYSLLYSNKTGYTANAGLLKQNGWGTDSAHKDPVGYFNSETTPVLYTVPVNKEIVSTGEVIRYDDFEKIISRNTTLTVSPCQCRLAKLSFGLADPAGSVDVPLNTCIATGEQAEYYLENGFGTAITQADALALLKANVEAGAVLQYVYSKAAEIICSCHGNYCGILGSYLAVTGDINLENMSHYTLQYDKSVCIKCGKCKDRCPMFTVTMGTDGYPAVGNRCVRCGQCGTTCPKSARKLVVKKTFPELPETQVDDYVRKGQYNLSRSKIY